MTTRSVNSLLSRLSRAGFKRDFVRPAILPDWWDESLASDRSLLPEIELRVARFLGISVADVRDPNRPLVAPVSPNTVLKKAKNINADSLRPAIHAARRVAEAVVRNLKSQQVKALPSNAESWRRNLTSGKSPVTLETMLGDLWERGIPVIPLPCLPSPSFQGIASTIEGRPVIVIGQKHDAPGRVSFFVAHEAGHIAAGDCNGGKTIVDEDESTTDSSQIEKLADRFASHVLLGEFDAADLIAQDYRELATRSHEIQEQTGAEAGALIFHWARKNNDYVSATQAVKALYLGGGARDTMIRVLCEHVNVEDAPETDRALLGLASGDNTDSAAD